MRSNKECNADFHRNVFCLASGVRQIQNGRIPSMNGHVLIIGAGVAGLTAGDELIAAGIGCTLLEASGRAGGRIRNLEGFADFPIELGAEEIHGQANILLPLADPADVLRHKSCDDFIRLDGKFVSLAETGADGDMRRAFDFLRDPARFSNRDRTADQALDAADFPPRTRHYLDSRLGVEHGTSLDRLGLGEFGTYEKGWEVRENNATVRVPYLDLFSGVLKRLKSHIKFHTEVKRVERTAEKLLAFLADGRVLETDAVIVTVPLAVLQEGSPVFDPPLPQKKKEAISGIGMDAGMKIQLRFKRTFWPANMYFLHSDGFFPQFWTPGHGRGGTANVLTTFAGGSIAEALKSPDPVEYAVEDLDRLFGNRAASENLEEAFVADWGAEPFIRGLYSYPLASTTHAHREALAAPVDGKIFFAGEATDVNGHWGTVHGAVESGRRAAREVETGLRERFPNRFPRL